MNNTKLNKLILSIGLLMVSVLVACSSDEESGGSSSGDANTVEVWHSMTDTSGEAIEQVIEEFEQQNPDIKIEATYVANQGEGQNEKLLTAIAGGNPPDVAYFDRFEVAAWAAQGSLEPLTELAEQDGITEDNYYGFAWEEASFEDDLYAIPTTTDSRLLFYNKDHFEEVGLDPENPPTTLDELEAAAEKLTIKEGNRFERIGFIPWYGQGWFYGWGWSFGGDFYDPESGEVTADHPQNVEALEWMTEFGQEYGVEDIAGFTDSQGSGAMDPFVSGQLSMKIDGNFGVASLEKFAPDLNYGVTPIPTPTGDNFTTWSGGWSVVIPKGANNQDGAWEFLKFFGSEEGQRIFSETSRDFSVIESVNESLGYTEDPVFAEFINILPESNARPVMTEGSLYWNALADAVEASTRGNGTPQENLEKVTQQVTEALGE
ncbi:ABC transporter substrate-binding protein [Gracilibacillus alcaliphilus]|uniref:ABC transporter substrate-binding protein n=1 Tax=Gracilibacillus alcaliphilus TaxID=1401441 RepID=UPI00195C27D1|nr:ABC transporter substrate-binding protein [Gracilibacillus alcaliphilus]MBM7676383.1 multiple sugar transport system substrate-binding protein [Gracilibacillus alcaliphilus]